MAYWWNSPRATRRHHDTAHSDPCASASCPNLSGPATIATVQDLHGALLLNPCPGTCWSGFYVDDPTAVANLAPYAVTGQVLAVYGAFACGGVEGCTLGVTQYALTDCGPTPTQPSSWGRLKTLYR